VRILAAFFLASLVLSVAPTAQGTSTESNRPSAATEAAADRCQDKLDHIEQNGSRQHPDRRPTVITEGELNAYFAAGRVKLNPGLDQVRFSSQPGTLTSDLLVDFDKLSAGQRSSNLLLGLFTGIHNVRVIASGKGSGGIAHAHIQSVTIDEVQVPRFLLELFVEKVLQPRYPQAAMDPDFKMPAKVDTVILGEHKYTLIQK
jgi:hypothetical protein